MLQKRSVILIEAHTDFFFLVAKAPMLFVAKKMMRFRADHLLQEKAILSVMHCCFSSTWKALFEINNIHKPDFHYPCYLMPSFLFQRQLHIWDLGWNFPLLWTWFWGKKRCESIKSLTYFWLWDFLLSNRNSKISEFNVDLSMFSLSFLDFSYKRIHGWRSQTW